MLSLIMVSLLVCQICAFNGGSNPCPPGWPYLSGKCYRYIATRNDWAKSEEHCSSLGGHLASVHGSQEYTFIKNLIKKSDPNENPMWIGLTNRQEDKVWLWSDGTKLDFTKWNVGEPNNVPGAENCVVTNWGREKGWNDISCCSTYPSVCMLERYTLRR